MSATVKQVGGFCWTTIWESMGPGGTAWSGSGLRHLKNGPWNDADQQYLLAGHEIIGIFVNAPTIPSGNTLFCELDFPHPAAPLTTCPIYDDNEVAHGWLIKTILYGFHWANETVAAGVNMRRGVIIPGPVRVNLIPTYASGNGPTLTKLDLITRRPPVN